MKKTKKNFGEKRCKKIKKAVDKERQLWYLKEAADDGSRKLPLMPTGEGGTDQKASEGGGRLPEDAAHLDKQTVMQP